MTKQATAQQTADASSRWWYCIGGRRGDLFCHVHPTRRGGRGRAVCADAAFSVSANRQYRSSFSGGEECNRYDRDIPLHCRVDNDNATSSMSKKVVETTATSRLAHVAHTASFLCIYVVSSVRRVTWFQLRLCYDIRDISRTDLPGAWAPRKPPRKKTRPIWTYYPYQFRPCLPDLPGGERGEEFC